MSETDFQLQNRTKCIQYFIEVDNQAELVQSFFNLPFVPLSLLFHLMRHTHGGFPDFSCSVLALRPLKAPSIMLFKIHLIPTIC